MRYMTVPVNMMENSSSENHIRSPWLSARGTARPAIPIARTRWAGVAARQAKKIATSRLTPTTVSQLRCIASGAVTSRPGM